MKMTKFSQYLSERFISFKEVLKRYPVEMSIAAFTMVAGIMCYEDVATDIFNVCIAAPHLFIFAYILNNIFHCGKLRPLYYLALIPVAVICFIELDYWSFSTPYWIELLCLILAVPVVKKQRDNTGFVAENWWLFTGIVVTLFMVSVAWLLFAALVWATIELFNLPCRGDRIMLYFCIFAYTIAFALLILSYIDKRSGKIPEKTGVLSVLLNFIVTPALLAFNALFYAYLIKVMLEWELPAGYVAIMVFAFCLIAFGVKALRELLPKKRYGWYFDNLSLITIPALVLFWIGVIYRISQYGLTQSRVYLLICGLIMTASLAIFVCKNIGKYRWCWIIAIALLGVFTFIKPIDAATIGVYSQERRLIKLATELDLLEGPKKLKEEVVLPDTEPETIKKLEQLREALRYVYYNSDKNYGVEYVYSYGSGLVDPYNSSFLGLRGVSVYSGTQGRVVESKEVTHVIMPGYKHSGEDWVYSDSDRYLRIYCRDNGEPLLDPVEPDLKDDDIPEGYVLVWQKSYVELGATLLENAGITQGDLARDFSPDREQQKALTLYQDERLMLLFNYVDIYPGEDDLHYSNYNLEVIFIKK